ncbi:hypothetical protein SAMN05216548_12914 [Faunimonas pinastri]|uniref:Nucleoid associated protein NdpA n=1 Tax=Faunimonas pinastri TaxID=1855383 RepID=A0A1H9QIJ1_9HYPH|nr:hypothetical protein [Faunimonas pinastri]SER60248.1 hypothetical protein SAMN05216548_12914 [Faunimonas pinastri]
MGFLSDAEIDSLRLARMSLHIVADDADFEPQPELPVEHDDFLLQILRDVASDSIYRFADRSSTRDRIEEVARRDIPFHEGAQALSSDFRRFHTGNMRDGAFFVFELGVADESTRIYALVKYDYSQALELVQREGATALRRIVEAFVSDKASIQKAALVRTVDGVAEPGISTRDRMGRPAPTLTSYFQDYLQVERERNDQDLTREVRDVVRTALQDNKEYLPRGGVAVGLARALDVLRNAPEINEDVVRQAVWVGAGQPEDARVRGTLDTSVNRLVRRRRLEGVAFAPHQEGLPRSVRRQVQTEEGVTLEYNTALEGQAVRREEQPNGETRFVVTTRNYTDGVITERGRRPDR